MRAPHVGAGRSGMPSAHNPATGTTSTRAPLSPRALSFLLSLDLQCAGGVRVGVRWELQ